MQTNIPNSKEIILQILEIIDYQEDRNEFAEKFIQAALYEAFAKVIATLDPEKQLAFEKEIENKKPDEKSYILVQKYVDPQVYIMTVAKSTQDFLQDYINEIEPTLTDYQQQKLSEYIDSIKNKFSDFKLQSN
jgi:hypothetical protein